MKNILHCSKLLHGLCGRRKVLSIRKLLWLLVLLYVLSMMLAFHKFRENLLPVVEKNLVYQPDHSIVEPKLNLSKMIVTMNKTSPLAVSTKQHGDLTWRRNTDPGKNNVTEKTPPDNCRIWCRRNENSRKPFFLTAVLLVRIYVKDLPQLSTRELRQWFYYLRYAGFQHVYVYDAFVMKSESQAKALKTLIDEGFVTYTDWSHKAYPYSIDGTQHSAYQDCINRFGHDSQWQAAIDMDEYPFSPKDQKPLFAQRAVAQLSEKFPDASELTMQNFLFLGKPLDDSKHPLLIDRIWRRTHGPANALVKPIYRPRNINRAIVHHNALARGTSRNFPANELRMNHYWGARLQNWGDDTPEIIAKTQPDNSMKSIIKVLQNCIDECLPNTDNIYRKQWN